MCRTLGLSRAEYYRRQCSIQPANDEMQLRNRIQEIALLWPSYGTRRITKELRRQGEAINCKRVQRWMWKDNLLCLRKKKFVKTTDLEHGLLVYPNLQAWN